MGNINNLRVVLLSEWNKNFYTIILSYVNLILICVCSKRWSTETVSYHVGTAWHMALLLAGNVEGPDNKWYLERLSIGGLLILRIRNLMVVVLSYISRHFVLSTLFWLIHVAKWAPQYYHTPLLIYFDRMFDNIMGLDVVDFFFIAGTVIDWECKPSATFWEYVCTLCTFHRWYDDAV